MKRKFGILMPVFSLDGEYGIGTFGKSAYDFVDFLSECGVYVWQILPLCPVGPGGSPYSSPCANAISPCYIDPDILVNKGLLTSEECAKYKVRLNRVDYSELDKSIMALFKKAYSRFNGTIDGYEDYALYMALKCEHDGAPWYKWGKYSKYHSKYVKDFRLNNADKIRFWQFVQSEAFSQWRALRSYAKSKGVVILGDIPFYEDYDSLAVWKNRTAFMAKLKPDFVAGVPPDYFSQTGQLWGNPVYDWQNKKTAKLWNERIYAALSMYDMLRLDHFRAFDEYYAIPRDSIDAKIGEWKSGPGMAFFADKKDLPIIAEDLGTITPSVRRLLTYTGYPGMKVIQFAFDGSPLNPHLPSNIRHNSVCYTGTHDNMPLKQFITSLGEGYSDFVSALSRECDEEVVEDIDELIDMIIELGCSSDAKLFIVPLIDIMHLGAEYRINTPSTVSELNWSARLDVRYHDYKDKIKELIKRYNRI